MVSEMTSPVWDWQFWVLMVAVFAIMVPAQFIGLWEWIIAAALLAAMLLGLGWFGAL